jgi:hypothetical protein
MPSRSNSGLRSGPDASAATARRLARDRPPAAARTRPRAARTSTIVCAGLLLAAAAAQPQSQATDQAPAGRHTAGLLSEVVFRPLGFDDPYSWMLGAGAFYERRLGASDQIVAGGRFVVYGQYALEPLFEKSIMVVAGPYVGWEILRRTRADATVSIVPYVGAAQYWRRFGYDGEEYRASRTIIVLGINVDLLLGARMTCGVASEPLLILDQAPVVALGQIQRLAARF